jgi:hypothetical protein
MAKPSGLPPRPKGERSIAKACFDGTRQRTRRSCAPLPEGTRQRTRRSCAHLQKIDTEKDAAGGSLQTLTTGSDSRFSRTFDDRCRGLVDRTLLRAGHCDDGVGVNANWGQPSTSRSSSRDSASGIIESEEEPDFLLGNTWEQDQTRRVLASLLSSREQDRETNGLISAPGTRTPSAAHQAIAFTRTRPRDKRSHRRAGNKDPERCSPNDRKRCQIRDRSHERSPHC